MRSNPRCVFDTNVLVSALLFDTSKPARAFFTTPRDGEVLVSADVISELNDVVSADVISELNDVLGREKFRRYVTEEERGRFLRSLLREARLVEVREKIQA